MKGFNTGDGYMGMVDGEYILFASEADYYDYVNDQRVWDYRVSGDVGGGNVITDDYSE